MMFAHIASGVVDAVGDPPLITYDGTRWWDLRTLDPVALTAANWYPVVETARPADTATTTCTPVFTPTGTEVTQSWVEVPKTQEQLDADDREAARIAIRAIVTDLRTEKDRCDMVLAKTAAQITGGDTKDVARAAKRIADAAIDLARFLRD